MKLLQNMGVCFVIPGDDGSDFSKQSSIVPAYLPVRSSRDEKDDRFKKAWPNDPPPERPSEVERVLKFHVIPSELVSRLLVSLHSKIQDDLVWKNEVVLVVKDDRKNILGNTQAWIKVEEIENRFVVKIRGKNHSACIAMLDFIVGQVREVHFQGAAGSSAVWEEKIRSPHYGGGVEIDIQRARDEAAKPLDKRTLVCPETLLPIHPEQLLVRAGLRDPPEIAGKTPQWWDFHLPDDNNSDVEIWRRGKHSCVVKHEVFFEKFKMLFEGMGGDLADIDSVSAIINPVLANNFSSKRVLIGNQQYRNPSLFRSEDWRDLPDKHLRKATVMDLNGHLARFPEFNDGSLPFVAPIFQGTSYPAAMSIKKDGFGLAPALASNADRGYFGRGMYFTKDIHYAAKYAQQMGERDRSGVKPVLLSLVIPGNPYPVTEHPFKSDTEFKENPKGFYNKGLKSGYQSHVVLVKNDTQKAFPAQFEFVNDPANKPLISDELVLFESAQALPLFIVYYREPWADSCISRSSTANSLDGMAFEIPPPPADTPAPPPPPANTGSSWSDLLYDGEMSLGGWS